MKGFIANIPHSYIVRLGRLLGLLLCFLDVPHRRLVRRNLRFCYPEWSDSRVTALSRSIFRNAGITFLEIFQSEFISQEKLLNMFRIEGEQQLINALEKGKGAVIISAHMGNWELGPQFLGCYLGRPLNGVARRMHNPWMDRWFDRLRVRFGNRIIYKKGALPKMTQVLRNGEMLGLTIDQSRRKQGIEVSFFNRRASTTPAAALLAIRCRSPVIPIFCTREVDGTLTIHVRRPLELKRGKDLLSDLQTNSQLMMDALEKEIREHPEQWVWFQRPWKNHYPYLYPEWEAKRRRRKRKKKGRLHFQEPEGGHRIPKFAVRNKISKEPPTHHSESERSYPSRRVRPMKRAS
jgi:KDO2-lipid IV(A) lauroyltransferase